jgi:hypothetical protein
MPPVPDNSEPVPDRQKTQDPTKFRNNYANVAPLRGKLPTEADEDTKEAGGDWAIIVNHGMGQQVHFETLESIALALRNAELRERKAAEPIVTRVVKLETLDGRPLELVRAEMKVKVKSEDPNLPAESVHVYESYWAPLTEGRVTLRDVLQFLGEGAFNGFAYLLRHFGRFDRWAFGSLRHFPIRGWLTALKLLFALFLLFAPVVLANFLAATQSIHVLFSTILGTATDSSTAKAARQLMDFLTPYVACFEVCLVVFALAVVVLPKLYRSKLLSAENPFLVGIRFVVHLIALVLSFGALAGVVVVEVLLLKRDSEPLQFLPINRPWGLLAIWAIAIAAAFVSRWFLIQFIGDVAVYVSAHKLSKFDQLRDAIKQTVLNVMGAVYAAKSPEEKRSDRAPQFPSRDGWKFRYKKIIVVGHSLGSVISYDLLNQLLLEDELNEIEPGATSAGPLNIRNRTKLLLTFGSPLDKIAYLFRIKKSTDELRDAAISAWQPMIRDYAFRPDHWLNIYSWMDLFSAPLHFYDDPNNPANGDKRRVVNTIDWQAWVPIVAHTAYWTNPLLGDVLYKLITRPDQKALAAPRIASRPQVKM